MGSGNETCIAVYVEFSTTRNPNCRIRQSTGGLVPLPLGGD